jgi:hemin uptake protein HemP
MNSFNPRQFDGPRRPVREVDVRPTYVRPVARTLTSDSLFRGDHEIGIEHRGSLYRLKITRQGKLILNK